MKRAIEDNIETATLAVPVSERDHIRGPFDAPMTLLEYGDYQCPACGSAYPVVKTVQSALGKRLRFVFRNFPLTNIHHHAEHAAEAAEAASQQSHYWEMHDVLYENQNTLEDEELEEFAAELGLNAPRLIEEVENGAHGDHILEDFRSGIRSGVNGTPTFFINGARHNGPWDAESLVAALTEAATASR